MQIVKCPLCKAAPLMYEALKELMNFEHSIIIAVELAKKALSKAEEKPEALKKRLQVLSGEWLERIQSEIKKEE